MLNSVQHPSPVPCFVRRTGNGSWKRSWPKVNQVQGDAFFCSAAHPCCDLFSLRSFSFASLAACGQVRAAAGGDKPLARPAASIHSKPIGRLQASWRDVTGLVAEHGRASDRKGDARPERFCAEESQVNGCERRRLRLKQKVRGPHKPGSVSARGFLEGTSHAAATIHLGYGLLRSSSSQPGSLRAKRSCRKTARDPYLALLRVGFAMRTVLPRPRCAFTAPFHPCL